MNAEHPASIAARRSMEIVERRGKDARERWLALFADDAIVEDPIGPSPLDPEGKGHRGKAAIAEFWDRAIEATKISFDIERSYAAGDEVANVGSIKTTMPDGTTAVAEGVFTYKVDGSGKIAALRAFWEFDRMLATMRPGG